MITPRRTRLVRVRDLHEFRAAILAAALPSSLVVVPTTGAALQLRRWLQGRWPGDWSQGSPDLVTREQLYDRLHGRLERPPPRLSSYERDVVAQEAAREASASLGPTPAFQLRPGLVAEMLRFYDQLRRQGQRVARFEELVVELLQQDAEFDRGADRMLQQTRLLAATFRAYERRVAESGACDEHLLRERLLAEPAASSPRAVVVAVGDWIADPDGLYVSDFDLLARLSGVETLDVVATVTVLESGFHQRLHDWLPGLEEVEAPRTEGPARPVLAVPANASDRLWFRSRDREEELVSVARRLKADRRLRAATGAKPRPLERIAVVYKRPLPYLYLGREVFGGAGIPFQTSDTFPLAAEPFAAAVDLVLDFVASSFTRHTLVALLRSPHLAFGDDGRPIDRQAVSALDRALSDARYLGGLDQLIRLADTQLLGDSHADAAIHAAVRAARELAPLGTLEPASVQFDRLLTFLHTHAAPSTDREAVDGHEGGERLSASTAHAVEARTNRVRAAIFETLKRLAAASRVHGDARLDAEGVAATLRRWIEDQTFQIDPVAASVGLHLVDEQAARYGDFDEIVLAGLIEGEWPERPRRGIFYPPSVLRGLGWPSEKDWLAAAEARFLDLLRSPAERVWLSTITLDDDALVEPSSLLDDVHRAGLVSEERELAPTGRIFNEDALSLDPVVVDPLGSEARDWADLRLARAPHADPMFHGQAGDRGDRSWSVSAFETYLRCPFKFFAQYVLRLEEEPDDEEIMDPRTQGEFMHKVFETFFADWQKSGHGAISPENLDEARTFFEQVVERRLADLSETEAALERTRLLGSPAAAGLGDAVLRMEAERPVGVVGRLLEHPLRGAFTFETPSGPRSIPLKGKADRLDLLADGTFRLIDYKLGSAPNRARALQLPIYSLCAQQSLDGHLGRTWTIGEAVYVAFKGAKRVVPLFSATDRDRVLSEAQARLVEVVDAIGRGDFPPRPEDVFWCESCAYGGVCRKDYVDDV